MIESLLKFFNRELPQKQKIESQTYVNFITRDPQTHKIQRRVFLNEGKNYPEYENWKRIKYKSLNKNRLLEQIKGSFIDPQFPHNNKSISDQQSEIEFQWKRIPDFIQFCIYSSPETFKNFEKITLTNKKLKQALLFMYRTHQNKFRQFLLIDCNHYGLYQFKLYKKGIIQNVIIDDYVPVVNSKYPLMAGPIAQVQIFPMLLQKAIAKVCGGYDKIPQNLDEILQILFCGPLRKTKMNELTNSQIVSDIVQKAMKNHGVVGFISKSNQKIRNFGICQNQIYNIIDKFHVTLNNEPSIQLYQLISDKKLSSWNGRFSHNDLQWEKVSPNQRAILFKHLMQNKSFFISNNDIPRIFDHLIAFEGTDILNKDWLEQESETTYPSFSTFQLSSPDRVFIRATTPDHIRTSIIMAQQIEGKGFKYIKGVFHENTSSLEMVEDLRPGRYIICIHHDWILNKNGPYNLFLQSNRHIHLQIQYKPYPNFLEQLFKGMSQQAKKMKPVPDFLTVNRCYTIGMLPKQTGFAFLDFSIKGINQNQVSIEVFPKALAEQSWQILQPNAGRTSFLIKKGLQQQLMLVLKTHKYVSQKIVQFPSTAFKIKA